MKYTYSIVLCACLCFLMGQAMAQQASATDSTTKALEAVVVERYYTAKQGETSIAGYPDGASTFRIYIDLREGYFLQAVFGLRQHELRIETTTNFYNVAKGGAEVGNKVDERAFAENAAAFDSWISMGAATRQHFGVLKNEDSDGSILPYPSFSATDGLKKGFVPGTVYYGIVPTAFDASYTNESLLSITNGAWANYIGVQGENKKENKILIAQITTTGTLHFILNIQVADSKNNKIQFVAKNADAKQVVFKDLEQTIK